MKRVMMRCMYMLVLLGGLIAHAYSPEGVFFTDEELAVDAEQSSDESETRFQKLHRHLDNNEYQQAADFCEATYADPTNFDEWAILYGYLGHAQIVLGQPEGIEKIKKVIDNQDVHPHYRGWACRTVAHWMQTWGCYEKAAQYRRDARCFGYTD